MPSFHGHEDQYAEAAGRAFERVNKASDVRCKQLQRHRETLATRVAAAVDNPSRRSAEGLSVASEIRAHLKSMAESKRPMFLARATDAGDRTTVAAVLHAPPYLSGLTERQQTELRQRAARTFAPVDTEQLAATEATIERVDAARGCLIVRLDESQRFKNTPRSVASRRVGELSRAGRWRLGDDPGRRGSRSGRAAACARAGVRERGAAQQAV